MVDKKWLLRLALVLICLALAACGGNDGDAGGGGGGGEETGASEPAGDAIAGEDLYFASCVACHGPDAKGVENLGKDLIESEFIDGIDDAAFLAFVKTGRPVGDPENSTGIDMPPKGGNPALADEQILDIIAYIRSIR